MLGVLRLFESSTFQIFVEIYESQTRQPGFQISVVDILYPWRMV